VTRGGDPHNEERTFATPEFWNEHAGLLAVVGFVLLLVGYLTE
jgi:hypothetical protein